MYRHLRKIPFWSFGNSVCRLKSHDQGRRQKSIRQLWFCRAFATSFDAGHDLLGLGLKVTEPFQQQIINSLQLGKRDMASNLLVDLGNGNLSLGVNDFVDILKYCARSPDPLFAMETWGVMEKNNVTPNNICYVHMVQALCRGGYLDEASNLIAYTGECNDVYPCLTLYNVLLRACSKMQHLVQANLCLDLMERTMVGKNETTYLELLELAVGQQNINAVHEIWKNYVRHYIPSIAALRKFIWSFGSLGEIQSACQALQYMVTLVFGGWNAVISCSEESNIVKGYGKGSLGSSTLDIPVPYNCDLGPLDLDSKQTKQLIPRKSDTCSSFGNRTLMTDGFTIDQDDPKMKILKSSFEELIDACAKTQNSQLAKQLMLQMQKIGIQPSSRAHDGLVRALVHGEGLTEGMNVLKLMQQRNLKPHDSTLATLSIECSKNLELDLAEGLLNDLSDPPYPYACNEFLEACDRLDQPDRALRMLAKMKKLNLKPDIRTYELLFSLFGNMNAPYEEGNMWSQTDCTKRIKAIEKDMLQNGVEHSHTSMKNLLKALGAEGMIVELLQHLRFAEDLFSRNNIYLGTPIYNTVLHSLVEAKESHLAGEIFKNMRLSGVYPDAETYNIMIDCSSAIQCYKSALSVLCMMIRVGYDPAAITYTGLIKILMDNGDFDEALTLLDHMAMEGITIDLVLYNTVLDKAFAKGRIHVTEYVVEHMRRNGVQPDPTTCATVFSTYVRCEFPNTALEALQALSMRIMLGQDDARLEELKAKFEDDLIFSEASEPELEVLECFATSDEDIFVVALLNLRWCAILGSQISWSPDETQWARRLAADYDTRRGLV